jgi:DNA-3-methyladenine glycosylase I
LIKTLYLFSTRSQDQAFIKIQQEFGSFSNYIWGFFDRKTLQNNRQSMQYVPAATDESDLLSKDLKRRGFKFVGSTIIYAFMQATGIVNDHLVTCFRHKTLTQK